MILNDTIFFIHSNYSRLLTIGEDWIEGIKRPKDLISYLTIKWGLTFLFLILEVLSKSLCFIRQLQWIRARTFSRRTYGHSVSLNEKHDSDDWNISRGVVKNLYKYKKRRPSRWCTPHLFQGGILMYKRLPGLLHRRTKNKYYLR